MNHFMDLLVDRQEIVFLLEVEKIVSKKMKEKNKEFKKKMIMI